MINNKISENQCLFLVFLMKFVTLIFNITLTEETGELGFILFAFALGGVLNYLIVLPFLFIIKKESYIENFRNKKGPGFIFLILIGIIFIIYIILLLLHIQISYYYSKPSECLCVRAVTVPEHFLFTLPLIRIIEMIVGLMLQKKKVQSNAIVKGISVSTVILVFLYIMCWESNCVMEIIVVIDNEIEVHKYNNGFYY